MGGPSSAQSQSRRNMFAQGSDFDGDRSSDVRVGEPAGLSRPRADLADRLGSSELGLLAKARARKRIFVDVRASSALFPAQLRLAVASGLRGSAFLSPGCQVEIKSALSQGNPVCVCVYDAQHRAFQVFCYFCHFGFYQLFVVDQTVTCLPLCAADRRNLCRRMLVGASRRRGAQCCTRCARGRG